MGDWGCQFDVAHALTTNAGTGHFDTAALAHDALKADALVLTASALPIAGRTEHLLREQTVTFWLEGAVVDGFRLLDLAVAPTMDILGGSHTDPQLVKLINVDQSISCLSETCYTHQGGELSARRFPSCCCRPERCRYGLPLQQPYLGVHQC